MGKKGERKRKRGKERKEEREKGQEKEIKGDPWKVAAATRLEGFAFARGREKDLFR